MFKLKNKEVAHIYYPYSSPNLSVRTQHSWISKLPMSVIILLESHYRCGSYKTWTCDLSVMSGVLYQLS